MKTHYLPLCIALIAPAMCMYAQEDEKESNPGNKVTFVKTSADTTVYNILKKDIPEGPSEMPVPHFAIHTQNNKFVMTIGGEINPIVGCDWGNDLYHQDGAGISFVPGQIPVPAAGGKKSDFFINALNSNITLQVVGFGGTDNQITGYIKLGTNGNDKGVKLKKAYVSWRGFTAGLKNTLFQDGNVIPNTIDPQGPNGLVSTSAYELSYVSPSWNGFRFGLGVDMPDYTTSSGHYWGRDVTSWKGRKIEGELVCDPTYYNQVVPDIPMYIEWGKSDVNRIRLAGIIRTMNYLDVLQNKRRASVGWGLSLSGNYSPVEPLIFSLQATYGKGIAAYIQDLAGQPFSYVPNDNKPGYMTPTPMMGWSAAVTYNINPKWQVNLMASQARIWKAKAYAEHEATTGNLNNYKYGLYAAGNVFYNISSYFQVGLEYLYGYRKTWNAGGAGDNRLQMQFAFTL